MTYLNMSNKFIRFCHNTALAHPLLHNEAQLTASTCLVMVTLLHLIKKYLAISEDFTSIKIQIQIFKLQILKNSIKYNYSHN